MSKIGLHCWVYRFTTLLELEISALLGLSTSKTSRFLAYPRIKYSSTLAGGKPPGEVYVEKLFPNLWAEKQGLRLKDVLEELNGQRLSEMFLGCAQDPKILRSILFESTQHVFCPSWHSLRTCFLSFSGCRHWYIFAIHHTICSVDIFKVWMDLRFLSFSALNPFWLEQSDFGCGLSQNHM